MECPNIYCCNQENNECKYYIGLPIDCPWRDKYIKDHCPDAEDYENSVVLPETIDDLPF